MKRLVCFLMALVMTLSLAACGSKPDAGANDAAGDGTCEPLTLVWGDFHSSNTSFYEAMEKFRDLVSEKSGGAITIELYPDSTLGSQMELVEAVRSGDVDITYTSTFSVYSPEFKVYDLPFVWDDYDHIERALFNGEVGEYLAQKLNEESGLRIMNWQHAGFRNFYTKKTVVNSIDDLHSVKMRSPETETYVKMFECINVAATPLPWNDTYEAIRSGVVDGAETNIEGYINFSIYEVAPNVAMVNHMYTCECAVMSEEKYQSLTDTQKKILDEAFQEIEDWFNPKQRAYEAELIEKLTTEYGCTVTYPDRAAFREACTAEWDWLAETLPETDEILAMIDAARE